MLLVAIALICISGTALAAVFMPPTNSPVYFQFNNMEQLDTTLTNSLVVPGGYNGTNTQGNWGVVNLSSIQLGAVATPHVDISGGQSILPTLNTVGGPQITGLLFGVDLITGTTAHNGFVDLYWHDVGNVTATCLNGGCGPTAATVTQFTTGNGGIFLARLMFDSGILPGDGNVDILSQFDVTTLGGSGTADSFLSVDTSVPGLWTNILNGDWFFTNFGTRDIRLSSVLNNTLPAWGNTQANPGTTLGIRSNDPGRVFTTIPEPGTIVLLGFGLLGLGGFAARRKK